MEKRQKKKIIYSIILGISAFLLLSTIVATFIVGAIKEHGFQYVTEFSGTVDVVMINDGGKSTRVSIFTEEYAVLSIDSSFTSYIDLEKLKEIKRGDKIYFCTLDIFKEDIYTAVVIPIYSLSTDYANIFSVDDYVRFFDRSFLYLIIAVIVESLVFISVIIFCIIRLRQSRGGVGKNVRN